LIPPIIILSSFYYLFFNFNYWQKLFQKSEVYQTFTKEDADQKAENVLGFYKNKNVLEKNFFSGQAILHLTDVKRALYLSVGYFSLSLSALLIITSILFIKKKAKLFLFSLAVGSGFTALLISALGLGLTKGFNQLFLIFHKKVFSNDLWLFPPDDNLVKLFPTQFFVFFANRLAIQIILTSLVISILTFLVRKKLYDSA
ncbi:DUF1461 domain-containing protein, partial [Candidatus Curtissbacteria bacterium]|nr:DUF1461 domain-containing protein [Candidatus Curtissbacteria bacterium]